jgi:hypothetical protein
MSGEEALTTEGLIDLWCNTFGEPPSIVVEPQFMLHLIHSHRGWGTPGRPISESAAG